MTNNKNRCYNCIHREDGGEGDTWCKKRQTGYRAEQYDCKDFVDREKYSTIYGEIKK